MTFTAKAANAKGTVNYTFLLNDGSTLKASSTSNTCTWTPSKTGKFIVAVRAKDSEMSITATANINVSSAGKLSSTSRVSNSKITLGSSVTLYGAATGGASPYQFAYYYKKSGSTSYAKIKDYSTSTVATFKPASATSYELLIKVKDKSGSIVKSTFALSVVKPASVTNTSTISASSIAKGKSATITLSGTGGTGSYTYAVWYRKAGSENWLTLQKYGTTKSVVFTPASAGSYELLTKVQDSAGSIGKKTLTLKVTDNGLANTSKVSSTSIALGSTVTVTLSATGGKTPYQYAVYYKKSASENWTYVQGYSTETTAKIKPGAATSYDILTKVKDSSGTIVKKTITVKVTK